MLLTNQLIQRQPLIMKISYAKELIKNNAIKLCCQMKKNGYFDIIISALLDKIKYKGEKKIFIILIFQLLIMFSNNIIKLFIF